MLQEVAFLEMEAFAQPWYLVWKAYSTKSVDIAALMREPGGVGVYAVLVRSMRG